MKREAREHEGLFGICASITPSRLQWLSTQRAIKHKEQRCHNNKKYDFSLPFTQAVFPLNSNDALHVWVHIMMSHQINYFLNWRLLHCCNDLWSYLCVATPSFFEALATSTRSPSPRDWFENSFLVCSTTADTLSLQRGMFPLPLITRRQGEFLTELLFE